MAEQFVKSEQINSYMQMVWDYDQKFTKKSEFLNALRKALGETVSLVKYQGTKGVYLYESDGMKHYMICASITYFHGSRGRGLYQRRLGQGSTRLDRLL